MGKPYTICGAKAKSTGGVCQNRPMPGRTRCRFHGGKTPIGRANPSYKHGRYSKVGIPDRLREHLERAEADESLMSLRGEIELTQAAIAARLESPVAREQLAQLVPLAREVRDAAQDGVAARLAAEVLAIAETDKVIDEAVDLAESKARLIQAEWRRQEGLGIMISADRAYALVDHLVEVIKEAVSDHATLARIAERFAVVVGAAYCVEAHGSGNADDDPGQPRKARGAGKPR